MVQVAARHVSATAHGGRLYQAACALMLTLVLAGCGSSGPLERDRFYALQPWQPVPVSVRAGGPTLRVNAFAARGFLGGRQIVFRTRARPLEVERYDDYLWADPVPRALPDALVGALRAAGLFGFVGSSADSARTDYLLDGEVLTFEHRPTAVPPQVAVAFDLTLVRGRDRRALWNRSFSGERVLAENTPRRMVEAFNVLTGELVSEAVREMRSLVIE